MVPHRNGANRGSVENFKAFIRELALEGENIDGKLSIPTQVAVLATLALFYTQAWLFKYERDAWEMRKEREDHAGHYADFETDYGCGDDCTHPDHNRERRIHDASERARQEGFLGWVETAEGRIDGAEVRDLVRNNEVLGEGGWNEDEFDMNPARNEDDELDAV